MAIEFTVETAEIKKFVNFVRNGLGSSKTDIPVQLIRMDLKESKLTLFAANKEFFARGVMKVNRAEESKDGAFAVLGQKLIQLVNTVNTETITVKVDEEAAQVSSKFLNVSLVLYEAGAVKQAEEAVSEHLELEGSSAPRAAFEEALACAKSCTTANSIRPEVTHVELRKGRVLSSDGRKIMIYSHDGLKEELTFKVPAAVLNSVLTAVKNLDAESVQLIEGANYYFLKGGLTPNQFTAGVRKVERDFPAVEDRLTQGEDPTDEVSVDKNLLESAIRGVALGLESDDVKVTIELSGKGVEGSFEISALNSLGKKSWEKGECGRSADKELKFPISFKHLLDTLGVFKGDSVVDLYILEDKSLAIVRDSTEDREVSTIIPFRTDAAIEAEKKEKAEQEAARQAAREDNTDDESEVAAAADDVMEDSEEDVDI